MNRELDLTTGSIWKKLLLYVLPIAAGAWIQQLYNVTDALIIGRFAGTTALAAVGGSSSVICSSLIGLFTAFTAGFTVLTGQMAGAKNREATSDIIASSLMFCLVLGLVLSAVLIVGTVPILQLMKVPEETIPGAAAYLRIYFSALVINLLMNLEAAILRAVGDSRSPFYFLMLSCGANILMDYLFVACFGFGIYGVATATVIAQCISFGLITRRLFGSCTAYELHVSQLHMNVGNIRQALSIGVPNAFQELSYNIGDLFLSAAINTLGTAVVAGWSLSGKLNGFFWVALSACGAAVTGFVAQNYGAGLKERVHRTVRTALLLFAGLTFFASALLILIGRPVLAQFTMDPEVLETAVRVMWYQAPFFVCYTIACVLANALRAIGDVRAPVLINLATVCGLRLLWIVTVFARFHTLKGIAYVYPASWMMTAIGMIIYYRYYSKMRKL